MSLSVVDPWPVWIVVPGEWADRDLRFQAENLAGSIVSNGSFNCVCPRVIVTSARWPQRARFLGLLRAAVAAVPPRPAFYAGAIERLTSHGYCSSHPIITAAPKNSQPPALRSR